MNIDLPYIVTFSFIQGFTEFLPVSSSAHLLALPHILGEPDQGVVMDVAAHVGSLLAGNLCRNPSIAVLTLAVFGMLLWAADRHFHCKKGTERLSFKDALIIGCGQALAVVPGVSRSGMCLIFGLARGLSRKAAVEFAFLLSIPTLTLAGAGAALEYVKEGFPVNAWQIAATVALSFLFSIAAIRLMLAWVSKFSLAAFAAYRIVFAAMLAHLLFR